MRFVMTEVAKKRPDLAAGPNCIQNLNVIVLSPFVSEGNLPAAMLVDILAIARLNVICYH